MLFQPQHFLATNRRASTKDWSEGVGCWGKCCYWVCLNFLKFVFDDQFICIIYNYIRSSLDGLLIIETASQ